MNRYTAGLWLYNLKLFEVMGPAILTVCFE